MPSACATASRRTAGGAPVVGGVEGGLGAAQALPQAVAHGLPVLLDDHALPDEARQRDGGEPDGEEAVQDLVAEARPRGRDEADAAADAQPERVDERARGERREADPQEHEQDVEAVVGRAADDHDVLRVRADALVEDAAAVAAEALGAVERAALALQARVDGRVQPERGLAARADEDAVVVLGVGERLVVEAEEARGREHAREGRLGREAGRARRRAEVDPRDGRAVVARGAGRWRPCAKPAATGDGLGAADKALARAPGERRAHGVVAERVGGRPARPGAPSTWLPSVSPAGLTKRTSTATSASEPSSET